MNSALSEKGVVIRNAMNTKIRNGFFLGIGSGVTSILQKARGSRQMMFRSKLRVSKPNTGFNHLSRDPFRIVESSGIKGGLYLRKETRGRHNARILPSRVFPLAAFEVI